MFWSCPSLTKFWSDIFNAYSKRFRKVISPNPICALFGFTPETRSIRGKAFVVIAFTSLLARRLILLACKQTTPPSFTRWIKETMYFLKLEKIKFTHRGSAQKFKEIWTPFLDFYESLQVQIDEKS